ncbi:phytoene desaturase family protein [Halobacterium sp. KA-6]|uniref:phytoene desaturase family protein n=1 Tax=Halobacterium sp. KA-6 TaxID=2896368 RepID=UPI001E2DCD4A|nr:NAD(P)/FAD-dependent oxidoreductase [Halobacterium sp. KA-6]MCD2204496.1 NAD(P)/FAD-dependent oxidoreductase [Halobacterium sp. KA-6]
MSSEQVRDAVVIGAGLGGLVSGAKLAQAGKQVLVLEQHSIPGGCATTFERQDFEFDVSLHEIDGFDEHDIKREIFADLGVLDRLSFEPIADFYRYRRGNQDIAIPHGREDACERLASEFPEDAEGIRTFYDVILDLRESLLGFASAGEPSVTSKLLFALQNRTFLRHRNETLGSFLDDVLDGDAPKRVLTANLGYYHDDPYSLSLPFFAVAQGGYIANGGYYIKGGSQRLADCLVSLIEEAGGRAETDRRVTDIRVDDGQATGVRHEHSRSGTTTLTGQDVQTNNADTVVANAAVPLVAENLLPAPHGNQLGAQFDDWKVAPSLTTLYLGFDTPPQNLGCEQYSTVIQHPSVDTLADVASVQRVSYGRRTLTFVDYSQIDAELTEDGQSVGAVSTIDYLDEWTGLKDAEYREKKALVKTVLRRRLVDQYPQLDDAIAHAELATPKTIQRYTMNPSGTAYGFAQTPSQSLFDRRVEPPISNLRFASAWTFPGGGFTGAIISGHLTAESILSEFT